MEAEPLDSRIRPVLSKCRIGATASSRERTEERSAEHLVLLDGTVHFVQHSLVSFQRSLLRIFFFILVITGTTGTVVLSTAIRHTLITLHSHKWQR